MVIESAFSTHPGGVLEFYTDANPDQLSWATDSRWIQHCTVYRGPSVGFEVAAFRLVRDRKKRNLNHTESDARPVEVFNHPELLPKDAQALLATAEQRNVEFGVHWYCNLVNAVYPENAGVRFYVLRDEKQVLAVLPIRAEKCTMGWRLESLSNFYTSLYEPALVPNLSLIHI